jgi:hypothetical protein
MDNLYSVKLTDENGDTMYVRSFDDQRVYFTYNVGEARCFDKYIAEKLVTNITPLTESLVQGGVNPNVRRQIAERG